MAYRRRSNRQKRRPSYNKRRGRGGVKPTLKLRVGHRM